ncbi:twin-arginine translocase TatA/TatE family subunit [Phosphitispora sp. TUW77]|uniref:twin-arginine translocase TatA/TatE family subunit n=1 Tax=Phosphitispora sp. TUW77 TaxID=3152361 RepID=UPI003AB6A6AA
MTFGFAYLGVKELILILVIVLIIFGPKKLPDIGRSFGEMLSNFRSSAKDETEKAKDPDDVNTDKTQN